MRLTTTQNKYICEIIKTSEMSTHHKQGYPNPDQTKPVPQPTSLASLK